MSMPDNILSKKMDRTDDSRIISKTGPTLGQWRLPNTTWIQLPYIGGYA